MFYKTALNFHWHISAEKTYKVQCFLDTWHLKSVVLCPANINAFDAQHHNKLVRIEINPRFENAHSNLGIILTELGKLDEAETSFSKAIFLNPTSSSILMNRSQLFFEKKEFNKALIDADSCNTRESRVFSLIILYTLGSFRMDD